MKQKKKRPKTTKRGKINFKHLKFTDLFGCGYETKMQRFNSNMGHNYVFQPDITTLEVMNQYKWENY